MAEIKTPAQEMSEIKVNLGVKADGWTEAYKYHELGRMNQITKDMDEMVSRYNDLAESEILRILSGKEKPLLEAAKVLKYATIGYKDVAEDKDNPDDKHREVTENMKYINTEKLHKKTATGVGENPEWIFFVQRFNFLLTARQSILLGMDPAVINACYAMKQEARKLEGLQTDGSATNEIILHDLDMIVKMMIGDEYTPELKDVAYLQAVYSKKNNKSKLTVTASNHANMRYHMLDICHRIITNGEYTVDFKMDKKRYERYMQEQLESSVEAPAAEQAPAAEAPKKTEKSRK